MWRPLSNIHVLKTMRVTAICNGPERITSASGGFGLLQMVSEPNTGGCAGENGGFPRGVDCENRLERETKHSV